MEIQSQHWGENRQLSMEGIAIEYYQIQLILVAMKTNMNFIHIKVMTTNKIHAHIFHILSFPYNQKY